MQTELRKEECFELLDPKRARTLEICPTLGQVRALQIRFNVIKMTPSDQGNMTRKGQQQMTTTEQSKQKVLNTDENHIINMSMKA